jgi:hypothetical protein
MVMITPQRVRVEWIDDHGELHYRHVCRRAIDVSTAMDGSFWEFRYRGKRAYARPVRGLLVCNPQMWGQAYAYKLLKDIAA